MDTALIKTLKDIFKQFPNFWSGETLQRSLVIDAIQKKEADVIKALINNEKIKIIYSTDIEGVLIFDFDKLISLLKYKEYWADSFTKYRNKIGLTSEGKYLDYSADVVLDFPFKDCMLEGGMTKEDQGKDEVYYNEVIARDEIDRLFSPKFFTNTKRYTKDGIEENITFDDEDNLIIKGNNLIVLHSLKERYKGKVKLIYIDPPYNTGGDSFKYNDRFNHATWLTFMKNRLEISRELLRNDGVILINLDETEHAYAKILCDEVFGRSNFVGDFIWKKRKGGGNDSQLIALDHDYILIFTKDKEFLVNNKIKWRVSYEDIYLQRYKEFDEVKGKKFYWDTLARDGLKNPIPVEIQDPDGGVLTFNSQKPLETIITELNQGNIRFYKGRNGWVLHHKVYQPEDGKVLRSLIELFDDLPTNKNAKDEMIGLFNDSTIFSNPKPEKLLKQLIELVTIPDDLVLDFHVGSGTTAAVAHKMGRRYIGIEQMDYINEITVQRLQKVIEGEQGGISKVVNWQGGGSVVYTELMELNYLFIHKIVQAEKLEDLLQLFDVMKAEAHLNYQIELEKVLNAEYEIDGIDHLISFSDLELSQQKTLLVELLDKNQLYVNFSEMDDENLAISECDKAFTTSFYRGGE
ncbi:DNA methyltransferase [Acinetobacter guillouiae]|uniref:DNA methyltransferase n=1 Tax=Acinetobacter guillouiae TaxID=106649 RepID=UPI003AF5E62C